MNIIYILLGILGFLILMIIVTYLVRGVKKIRIGNTQRKQGIVERKQVEETNAENWIEAAETNDALPGLSLVLKAVEDISKGAGASSQIDLIGMLEALTTQGAHLAGCKEASELLTKLIDAGFTPEQMCEILKTTQLPEGNKWRRQPSRTGVAKPKFVRKGVAKTEYGARL